MLIEGDRFAGCRMPDSLSASQLFGNRNPEISWDAGYPDAAFERQVCRQFPGANAVVAYWIEPQQHILPDRFQQIASDCRETATSIETDVNSAGTRSEFGPGVAAKKNRDTEVRKLDFSGQVHGDVGAIALKALPEISSVPVDFPYVVHCRNSLL